MEILTTYFGVEAIISVFFTPKILDYLQSIYDDTVYNLINLNDNNDINLNYDKINIDLKKATKVIQVFKMVLIYMKKITNFTMLLICVAALYFIVYYYSNKLNICFFPIRLLKNHSSILSIIFFIYFLIKFVILIITRFLPDFIVKYHLKNLNNLFEYIKIKKEEDDKSFDIISPNTKSIDKAK